MRIGLRVPRSRTIIAMAAVSAISCFDVRLGHDRRQQKTLHWGIASEDERLLPDRMLKYTNMILSGELEQSQSMSMEKRNGYIRPRPAMDRVRTLVSSDLFLSISHDLRARSFAGIGPLHTIHSADLTASDRLPAPPSPRQSSLISTW